MPHAEIGKQFIWPTIEDAEALQGFPRGWTSSASDNKRDADRWKMVGNAVTVGVSDWVGSRLNKPGDIISPVSNHSTSSKWPSAAMGGQGKMFKVDASEYPLHRPYTHLTDLITVDQCKQVSLRAASGFYSRLQRGNLGQHPGFREALAAHIDFMAGDETTR